MNAEGFLAHWPGTLILVWGPIAHRAAVKHFEAITSQGCITAAAVRLAIPAHAGLAFVLRRSTGGGGGGVVRQLYGAPNGYDPALVVDASAFSLYASQPKQEVFGVRLPAVALMNRPDVKCIESGPLYDAMPALVDQHHQDDDDVAELFCTSHECLLAIDPEIRCDECGRAFCSASCKFQATHFCY